MRGLTLHVAQPTLVFPMSFVDEQQRRNVVDVLQVKQEYHATWAGLEEREAQLVEQEKIDKEKERQRREVLDNGKCSLSTGGMFEYSLLVAVEYSIVKMPDPPIEQD